MARFNGDFVFAVVFLQPNVYAMIGGTILDGDANEVGLNRQLAAAAIGEDRQADHAGPAKILQCIERRANRSAGEDHVIHQQRRLAAQVDVDVGGSNHGLGAHLRKIVAI